jgi:hypothetical protein
MLIWYVLVNLATMAAVTYLGPPPQQPPPAPPAEDEYVLDGDPDAKRLGSQGEAKLPPQLQGALAAGAEGGAGGAASARDAEGGARGGEVAVPVHGEQLVRLGPCQTPDLLCPARACSLCEHPE